MSPLFLRAKNVILKPVHRFKTYSLKKKIFVIIGCFIILFILIKVLGGGPGNQGFETAQAARTNIIELVSETGSIIANGKVDIYSPSNGVVEEVYVRNGDIVTEGQELLKIKSTATEQEKAAALASYLAAKTSLDAANARAYTLRSAKDTAWKAFYDLSTNSEYENEDGSPRENNRNSSAEFQAAQADWLAAESNYKNQAAAISQAQAASSNTYLLYQATQNATVKATSTGTLSNLSVTTGSTVQANSIATPTTPLASVSNSTTTEVLVSLSENDIAKIREGQKVKIDVKAINDKTFDGVVRRVDSIGTAQLGVIRYNVYIEVLSRDSKLRPGMNVDVEITTSHLKDVLAVPNSAVKPYQGGRAVRVKGKKNEIEYLPVEIGVRGDEKTQIVKGISEGQEVITSLSNEQIKRQGPFGN